MIVFVVVLYFLFLIFIPTVRSLFDVKNDDVAQTILDYSRQHRILLELTGKIIDDDAGSMSSTYYGILNIPNGHQHQSVVVKYSSFKSLWNYVHASEINRLYDQPCRTHIDHQRNQYLVMRDDKNRIVTEGWIPAEIYIAFQAYFCPHLMPTAAIASPMFSYFSLFRSIQQADDQRYFFAIYQRLTDGISLKRFLQQNRDHLTMEQTKYWIFQILFGVLKLKRMSIIHLDLNSGNIFLMQHPSQHPIVFLDFAIMKFLHPSEQNHVFYSEILHQSLSDLFLNCPSCQSSSTIDLPPFAKQFQNSFKSLTIEQLIHHSWLFNSPNSADRS